LIPRLLLLLKSADKFSSPFWSAIANDCGTLTALSGQIS
jgi:hypothetical protein